MPNDMYLEHPDISYCIRTGYPNRSYVENDGKHWCEVCGIALDEDRDDIYEDTAHDYLCEDCLLMLHKRE